MGLRITKGMAQLSTMMHYNAMELYQLTGEAFDR